MHRLQNAGWLQAIASAAPRANVEAILTSLSATHIFQSIVSAEDVHHGKPDPEVYLVAASRVGVSPDCCIVVEDAAAGVEGARRAAMKSIGVNGNGGYLPADIAVKSLELLEPNAFETLLESRRDREIEQESSSSLDSSFANRMATPESFDVQTDFGIDEYLRKKLMPVEGAIPHLPRTDVYGNSIPAGSVGGDLFEYINFQQR